ncbi:MAG: Nif11-like leader peptide family natural product precursor [Synechococcus sp. SB0676_bin_10]|uniref:Nif11-like leader peptide family natural product n=1 Tax=Synechococcus sp. SB0676_bin_10 TaxID=2604869 RepID=A0A6B1F5P0_9SYNE|nr:Nif11-like leader peptide family RiPP precursor [Cyanobacteria bacterium MAG IRC3_bin_20]MDE0646604.1 Nif11-like leader peptide family RiPP precursor [Cyanobacteria bacterium MAG IRC4_bin_6]MXY19446.1 Nif11-like leader peptide family natural product precursor [Synechococcus sp. SB0664_bin_36]MYG38660.1 Nif11-like leader peptide family natural product precursor [Synechococcus sp. SB0676_bin_10]MYK07694.1 Nif11-like leader peptide family natural product precursor [Synechococcus sp. SB0670_bin_
MSEQKIPAFLERIKTDKTLAEALLDAKTAAEVIRLAAHAGLDCTAAEISQWQATRAVSRLVESGICANGLRWRSLHGPGGLHVQLVGTSASFGLWCPSC